MNAIDILKKDHQDQNLSEAELDDMGRRIEQLSNNSPPRCEEPGPVIELDVKHVLRDSRARQLQQIIADLAGPGTQVVTGAHGGVACADHRLLARIRRRKRIGRPQPPDFRINDAGVIVGTSVFLGMAPSQERASAVLWWSGTIVDLNTQIDAPGWILERATAINAAGWIVGQGTFQGQPRAFLLQPVPEELSAAPDPGRRLVRVRHPHPHHPPR